MDKANFEKTVLAELVRLNAKMDTGFGELRAEMKTEIGGLRTEMKTEIGGLRTEMRSKIGSLRAEMKTEIGSLRSEMHSETGSLRSELRALAQNTDRRFNSVELTLSEIKKDLKAVREQTALNSEEITALRLDRAPRA